MSPNAHLAHPDPELASLITKLGPSAPGTDDVLVLREQFGIASLLHQAEWEDCAPPASTYRVDEREVPIAAVGSREGSIRARCYIPVPGTHQRTVTAQGLFPLLVWYHGGGLVAGSIEDDDAYLRSICVDMQLVVVNVGYRLAPEHVFPTSFNDGYSGLKWAATHAHELNSSPRLGFLVGGTSAGAGLAASVALHARDDVFFAPGSGRHITGQLLQTPQLVHPEADLQRYAPELHSMVEQADAPFLTARKIRAFAQALRALPNDPRASPLLAPTHARLPRTFVQVFGLDPLRDEALLFARLLCDSGVEVRVVTYSGCPHTFNMIFPETHAAQKVDREFREGLRWLLTTSRSSGGSSNCLLG
ncbi:alpha/beta hydrolase fold-domain-containing protein [Trametes gibbosa]|nr:alpha/beta hydrolase fold-domain-containing protein [Trametes gibbosa]